MRFGRIASTAAVASVALIVSLVAAGSGPVPAYAQDPEAQVAQRQENMKRMGGAMKAIGAYIKNEGGSLEEVRDGAATLQEVALGIWPDLFPEGTGIGTSDSAAMPAIWQNSDDFVAAAAALEVESAKLVDVAAGGDRRAIAAQFGAVGRTCGSCHDAFRQKDE